jgi:hypothetical protein
MFQTTGIVLVERTQRKKAMLKKFAFALIAALVVAQTSVASAAPESLRQLSQENQQQAQQNSHI